ncbi:MAG TPA: ATP-grasp domain-containing protein [Clostridia bacterium]|nr:ATP-grasp domain-containing protein [Clostridia bacterium]
MENEFNLLRYITTERKKGTIVWLCNIGAERYWGKYNAGVVDRNENIIVNRIEEMNLLVCREQDIIILRKKPDAEYLDNLRKLGFSIPMILVPQTEDLLTPISELILEDETLLHELKAIASELKEIYFVPYAVTPLEEKIAGKTGLRMIGAPSDINAKVNDKIFNREISGKLGFEVCKGKVCSSVDEIRKEYEELTNSEPHFDKVIIKEPRGASGKGLYVIDNKDRLESCLRLITRFAKGRTDSKWLVEGWYKKKADINYQIYISPAGTVEVFSIKQQLLRDTVYIGSKMPPDLNESIIESYNEFGEMIGKYLFGIGFTGIAGIDSIITEQDVIVPIIEINGRFTLSTYISFVNNVLGKGKILSRYFRLIPDHPVGYADLCRELGKKSILMTPDEREGVFIYTSGTLPSILYEGTDDYIGRAFALIVSDNWAKIDEYDSVLQNVMEVFTKPK